MSRTVLFIHDAGATPAVWAPFVRRYTACGYRCHAPAWPVPGPHDTGGVASLARIVAAHAALARTLPDPPLLIGHGIGGLIVQVLLDRGMGAAGIAIAPVVSGGGWRAALACLRAVVFGGWAWAGLYRQAAFSRDAFIAFDNDHRAPLLLIAAANDRTIGAGAVAATYRQHRLSIAATDFRRFPGRSHWLIAEPGWEAVADDGMEWFQQQSGRS
jgi:alpha-beta hydrolase superfamily lysophospholipase